MTTLTLSFSLQALLCLLLAVGLLTSRALNPICARILGANYVLFALQAALAVMIFTDLWPKAALLRAQLAMLLGPALYIYVLSALSPHSFKLTHKLWHLLPVFLMTAILVVKKWLTPYWFIIDLLIIASFIGYWLAALHTLLNATQADSNNPTIATPTKRSTSAKTWLWVLVAFNLINIAVEIAITLEVLAGTPVAHTYALHIGGVAFVVFNLLTLLLILTRAPLLEWMHQLKRPSRPAISHAQQQQLFERWQTLIHDKNFYHTEQGITLARAARMLTVPAKQLSQAINGVYGASFSQHLNDIRVSHAKTLLLSQPSLPITDVLLQAGFSTKSHFHREFTRVTGCTPSNYRAQAVTT